MTILRLPALALIGLLHAYRAVISPLYGQTCRYYPSCSAYALESVQTHGAVRGAWATARRLARCHPFTDGGVDLVPDRERYRWWGRADGTDGESPSTSTRDVVHRGAESAAVTCDHREHARPALTATAPSGPLG